MSMLSDILSNLATGGSGTPSSATAAVPQTPVAPNYVPQPAIAQQYSLANQLRRVAPATSWAGVLAHGLGAIGGNLVQGDADNALAANQALRKTDIANAANATDVPTLEKSLITAQSPDLQNLGLETKIKEVTDDPNKEYRLRAVQAAQNGLKPGTPEFRQFVLTGSLAAPVKDEFTKVGQDAYGNPSYGFVNPQTHAITPVAIPNEAPTTASGIPVQGQTGAEFLSTLPKPMADQIKALSEGRMAFPSGFALKSPYWQKMISLVSQYDPSFDAVNYNARSKTRNDFTSGKSAQNITSFNTAIQHLDTLDKAIDGLGNGAYPFINSVRNTADVQMGDTKKASALSKFQTARQAVKEELTRAFKGSGGALAEVEAWDHEIDSSKSPEALHTVVRQAVNLLEGRIDSVGEQYSKGMGTTADPIKLLSPKAQEIWSRLNSETPDAAPEKIQGRVGDTAQPVVAPGVTHVWNPVTGQVEPVGGQ